MKKIFLFLLMLPIFFATQTEAAFEKITSNTGPKLLLAEVAGYGQYELNPEFMENFRDKIRESLQNSFRVESRENLGEINLEPTEEDKIFSVIHMDAIAHSRLYRRELANPKMTRYGDSILGKAYYQDEQKTEMRRKMEGKPYTLTPSVFEAVQRLGAEYNVDYMLFCNVRDADVWRKTGGIFGIRPKSEGDRHYLLGKRLQIEMEYYLVNVRTGKVFEGQNINKRTSLTTSVLIGKYGNNYTIADMVNFVLENQSDQLVKTLLKSGLKAVNS